MPVTYIGGNTVANASIASLSMTHGLTIQEGDVLIAIVNGNDTTTDGITDNNGSFPFTEAHQEAQQPVANSGQFAIFYRVAGTSEPSSYTFDQSGTDRFEWLLMQFRGVDVNDVFDIAPGVNSSFAESGTTATAPSITTTVDDAFAIAAFYLDSSSSFSAYTNSYTNEVQASPHNQAVAAVSKEIATAGATGAVAATISADRPWTAHHFALKPLVLKFGEYDSGGNTGSTWTVPISNPTSGNLLIAIGTADKDTAFANVPTGWTRIVSDIAVTAGVSSQAIYKISDGTETGVTFDITPTSVSRAGAYIELDGNYYSTLDVTSSNSNATAGTSLSTGATAAIAATLEVAVAMFGADSAQNVDLTRAYNTGYDEVVFTGEASAGTPSAQIAVKPSIATGTEECTFVTTDTGDQLLGILAVFGITSTTPTITDVANSGETPGSGTETWNDGSTGNVITGTNFL